MAKFTPNFNLKKPEVNEFYNVQDFNDNADIVDAELKKLGDNIKSVEAEMICLYKSDTESDVAYKIGAYLTKLKSNQRALLLYFDDDTDDSTAYSRYTCLLHAASFDNDDFVLTGEYLFNTTSKLGVSYKHVHLIQYRGTYVYLEDNDFCRPNLPIQFSVTDTHQPLTQNLLAIDNIAPFTPTGDYHPATKKYVDDAADKNNATTKNLFTNALKGSISGTEVGMVDVSPNEHDLTVTVRQKTLIAFPFVGSTTGTGVTFTDNGDGTITANGTATDTCFFRLSSDTLPTAIEVGKTYTLSGCPEGGSGTTYNIYIQEANGSVSYTDKGDSVTFTAESKSYKVIIRIYGGVTVSNLIFKPRLVEYRPYLDLTAASVTISDGGGNVQQSVNPAADGTVTGLKSLSPKMSICTEYIGKLKSALEVGDLVNTLYFDTSANIDDFLSGITYSSSGSEAGLKVLLSTSVYYFDAIDLSVLSSGLKSGYALVVFKTSENDRYTPIECQVLYSTATFDFSTSVTGLTVETIGWQRESTDYFSGTDISIYDLFANLNGSVVTIMKELPTDELVLDIEYNRDISMVINKIEDALSKLTDGNEVAY